MGFLFLGLRFMVGLLVRDYDPRVMDHGVFTHHFNVLVWSELVAVNEAGDFTKGDDHIIPVRCAGSDIYVDVGECIGYMYLCS